MACLLSARQSFTVCTCLICPVFLVMTLGRFQNAGGMRLTKGKK